MEKKYTFDDEDKEDNVVREPMAEYTRTSPAEYSQPFPEEEDNPLSDTPENIRKAAYRAIEQEKNGEYKTHEEAVKMFPFLYE